MILFTENTTIVLTGELDQCDRMEFADIVSTFGGAVSGSVSRRTTALVVGNGASAAKIERARDLGVPILTEQEFWDKLAEQFPPQK